MRRGGGSVLFGGWERDRRGCLIQVAFEGKLGLDAAIVAAMVAALLPVALQMGLGFFCKT